MNQVTKDGVQVENIDQFDDQYKQIGFLFELAPGKTTDIKINYQLNEPLKKDQISINWLSKNKSEQRIPI